MAYKKEIKERAKILRKDGLTYTEIKEALKVNIPQGTLSYWLHGLALSQEEKTNILANRERAMQNGRAKAVATNKLKYEKRLGKIRGGVAHLTDIVQKPDIAKISLAMLYLCEGTKRNNGSLCFGNSSPAVIALFLKLLRRCYPIDENKFRITVQCRADQASMGLESFWSKITNVPLHQFYPTRIDPRTIGKPSKKLLYKGVCRIDYFSASVYTELTIIAQMIMGR